PADPQSGLHFCFQAPTRKSVEAFHAAALAAEGTDNGKPGFRKDYGPNYYATYVVDPDGYRLEAHCGQAVAGPRTATPGRLRPRGSCSRVPPGSGGSLACSVSMRSSSAPAWSACRLRGIFSAAARPLHLSTGARPARRRRTATPASSSVTPSCR